MKPQSSDIAPIAGLALKKIVEESGCDLSRWNGPEVVYDPGIDRSGDYKVEWRPPDEEESLDEVLTIYSDGDWELYIGGDSFYGSMPPFHDISWIGICQSTGVISGLAKSSWMFFRSLSNGEKR